jgi:hypothetical protein
VQAKPSSSTRAVYLYPNGLVYPNGLAAGRARQMAVASSGAPRATANPATVRARMIARSIMWTW